jgi:hypothetical protein
MAPLRGLPSVPALIALITVLAPLPAAAQMFKDAALQALYLAERNDELERSARQRLAAAPDDAQAVLAAALGALRSVDPARRTGALAAAETCLERLPQSATCHYALGALLVAQGMNEGMLRMAASLSRVRASLATAMELEPAWFPPRAGLVEFYLQAPGIAGGSVARAREIARGAPQPDQVRALEGRIAWYDKRFDAALAAFAPLERGPDRSLALEVRNWSGLVGFDMLRAGQVDAAEALFKRLAAERPADAIGAYGLARVAAARGEHLRALELYTASEKLKGASGLPVAYRAGVSRQALGHDDAARALYQRFIAERRGTKRNLDDARRRLEDLSR